MGLFGFIKKKPQKSVKRQFLREEIDLQKKLKKQEEQIKEIKKAELLYEQTGDIGELLNFWQSIWDSGGLLFNGSKWAFRLPDLYIQVQQYDDALSILSKLEKTQYKDKALSYKKAVIKAKEKRKC